MGDRTVAYIVDDEPLMLGVLTSMLEGLNCNVTAFASAEAFLEINPEGPHLVVVDKQLPGISGLELVRKHRERRQDFEAILLTGHADVESAMEAVRLHFYSYLAKPFEFEDMMADVLGAVARLNERVRPKDKTSAARAPRPARGALQRLRFPVNSAGVQLPWESLSTNPLFEAVVNATDEQWTGEIIVQLDGETLGAIMMIGGKIGWATAKEQSENLGTFLWRLGHITRKQLEQVRAIYDRHGGTKKLSTIMEEEGLLTQPVLRHCLKLHMEFALTSLFAKSGATVKRITSAHPPKEQTLFEPEEVLPLPVAIGFTKRWGEQFKSGDQWRAISESNDVLAHFLDLPGYLASAVVSYDGTVLLAHFDASASKTSIFGVLLASTVEKAANLLASLQLGEVSSTVLTGSDGLVAMRWLDESRQYLAVLVADDKGDPTVMANRLEQYSEKIASWLRGSD